MTDQEANRLIVKGEAFETLHEVAAQRLHGQFLKQASYMEVPGTNGYYQCGSLRHGDTRKLFLMYLGCTSAKERRLVE